MTAQELKTKFFEYFKGQNHQIIDSASLIPDNDPTVLFTTAGMHPLVPYLMGEKHPEGTRLANIQKCLRTGDIDEVGDATHHTFFEMLGNWSLGDYFKKDTIKFSWEFLTKTLGLEKEKIGISIFGGNTDVPDYDKKSEELWIKQGVNPKMIDKVSENWWGPAGETGPCGPDTEMFYWTGKGKAPTEFHENEEGWVEIWNDVLMEYNKTKTGKFELLKQKNVDTGMGLERTLAVLNGYNDNYLTELFQPIIKKIEKLSGKKYNDDKRSFRIIADHIRSAVFILGDNKGVSPSNKDQGYVLRRLIRRAVNYARKLGINEIRAHSKQPNQKVTINKTVVFTKILAEIVINNYQADYIELSQNRQFILDTLEKEENKFWQTLENGIKELKKIFNRAIIGIDPEKAPKGMFINNTMRVAKGKEIFNIYQTYGLPIELSQEIVKEWGIKFDDQTILEAKKAFKKHQELSRTASTGMFKGGLADDGEATKKHHTAAHLLLEALRRVLGNHVQQKGSNINEQRIRFDFSHDKKMTDEEKKQVEELVNKQIKKGTNIKFQEMTVAESKKLGATGVFEHKYGNKVKVYFIGNFSKEICGGPHIANTADLGIFKITKENSSSAGVRRIKAILE